MTQYTKKQLTRILDLHDKWLRNEGGKLAYLSFTDLRGANFEEANLGGAYFSNSNLEGVSFAGANLAGVSFAGANLRGTDLRDTIIEGTTFTEARLKGAKILDDIELVAPPIMLTGLKYDILLTDKVLFVDSLHWQRHTVECWKAFSDEEIDRMPGGILNWWNTNKAMLFGLVEHYAAHCLPKEPL